MKNALILHGTDATSQDNWFPWLKKELTAKGWLVWVPDLPHADKPNISRYNTFLLSQPWNFNAQTLIIGHSSGAVAILGLLQALPENIVIDKAILVAGFTDNLGWENLTELFEISFDFEKIKRHAREFLIIQSDDDPYVPITHAQLLATKLGGKLLLQKGQKHFSISMDPHYKEFPFLLELID